MNRKKLLLAIELKRKQMIETALKYGLTHKKTIMQSKELDNLLNHLDNLNHN